MLVRVPWFEFDGVELANGPRVLTYLRRGLSLSGFSVTLRQPQLAEDCPGGYQDEYCLAPHHRLLTADLRWVPCGDLREGDELLGFDEEPQEGNRLRRWQPSTVTRSERAMKECVRVHLGNGDAIDCSVDHPWLVSRADGDRLRWVRAGELMARGNVRVRRALDPWDEPTSYEDGWLAGMLDGEGSLCVKESSRSLALTVSQKRGPVLDRIIEALRRRKFDVSASATDSSAMQLRVKGGISEVMRLLGSVRPMRLLRTFYEDTVLRDRAIKPWKPDPSEVVEVEPLGTRPVQSIATSTRTYVGEGYLMHNSDDYEVPCLSPANLACWCDAISDAEYLGPAEDPAPWFDAERPESEDFLGILPQSIEIDSAIGRTVTPRGSAFGGGIVSRLRPTARILAFTGTLFAANDRGLDWGESWVAQVLRGGEAGCAPDVARVLPSCPGDDEDPLRVFRELHEAGIVDGPAFSDLEEIQTGCVASRISFQLASGEARLREAAEECIPRQRLVPPEQEAS